MGPQAGTGLLSRQEVLELTALARALSDPRDNLALGAFCGGPWRGFTDEEILDAVAGPAPWLFPGNHGDDPGAQADRGANHSLPGCLPRLWRPLGAVLAVRHPAASSAPTPTLMPS